MNNKQKQTLQDSFKEYFNISNCFKNTEYPYKLHITNCRISLLFPSIVNKLKTNCFHRKYLSWNYDNLHIIPTTKRILTN